MTRQDALLSLEEVAQALCEVAAHDRDCILSLFEAGEPTPNGGYRSKFAGKWYQSRPVDETPKCDCGLSAALAALRAALDSLRGEAALVAAAVRAAEELSSPAPRSWHGARVREEAMDRLIAAYRALRENER